jgi:hypothetical protein
MFLDRILRSHTNILSVSRSYDIIFTVTRKDPNDTIKILCANEYAFSLSAVQRAILEFGEINIIFVGGVWNGYTPEAKEYCLRSRIGIYNAKEVSGSLWKRDYWAYHQKDEEGNIIYQYKTA